MAVDKLINETQGNDIIDKLDDIASNLENVSAITPAKLGLGYAVCDTVASTAAKVATLANYSLTEGGLVSVKFTYANTATNATLNLNSTGAKPIYYKGSAIGNDVISAGDIATFVYSTNAYNIVNIDTLTGAESGTVTQVGADNGLITDQTGGADIQRTGNIGLNLKSTTAYTGTVADPSSAVSVSDGRVYPVALDGDGHPVVGVPWTDTEGMIADAFDSTTAYSVGDYVTYEHRLYRFTSAHSAGAWNSAEVTEVSLSDQVSTNQTNILSVEDMVCDNEFNTTTAYAVGDIVTYEHGLYKFTSAHSAGAWNSSEVEEITTTDMISNKIGSSDYGSQSTGGTVRVWTTTVGTDTVLHISNQAAT